MAAPSRGPERSESSKPVSSLPLFFNVLNIFVLFVNCFALPQVFTSLDVVKNTFFTCKFYMVVHTLLHLLAFVLYSVNGNGSSSGGKQKGWLTRLAKTCCVFGAGVFVIYMIAVLYGAPAFDSVAETMHFSSVLAVLAVMPCCCILGLDTDVWIRVFAHNSADLGAESSLFLTTVCATVGAWLGAFPIPLDWDRPWQAWPVSCVLGTLAGFAVGNLLSIGQLMFRRSGTKKAKRM